MEQSEFKQDLIKQLESDRKIATRKITDLSSTEIVDRFEQDVFDLRNHYGTELSAISAELLDIAFNHYRYDVTLREATIEQLENRLRTLKWQNKRKKRSISQCTKI